MGFTLERNKKYFYFIVVLSVLCIFFLALSPVKAQSNETNGNQTGNQTNQTEQTKINLPWISPSVYEQLNKSEWAPVIVDLHYENIIDDIISILPETDFKFERKSYFNDSFSGNITRKGLDLLLNNSAVSAVYLGGTAQIALDKNKTTEEEILEDLNKSKVKIENVSVSWRKKNIVFRKNINIILLVILILLIILSVIKFIILRKKSP